MRRLVVLITGVVLLTATLLVPAPESAAAVVDGYPRADAEDYNPSDYEWWVDENDDDIEDVTSSPNDNDELVSVRGYYYRNCTDYVAWKLESEGVVAGDSRGNGKTAASGTTITRRSQPTVQRQAW